MLNYKKFIIKSFNNNYKDVNYHQNNLIHDFYESRLELKKIINQKTISDFKITNDFTFNLLSKNYFLKKKNKKKIFLFYKKFEYNLQIRSKYSHNGIAISKKETDYNSYIYLGNLILFLDNINSIQKLNIILKILDKIFININKFKIKDKYPLLNLINVEKNLIKKIIYDK